MTGEPVQPFSTTPAPTLPPEMTPSAIRGALIDEEREGFLRDYHEALVEADRTVDLSKVFEVLTNYHGIAWLRTGEAPAGSITADEMRALLAKRLAR